MSNPQQPELARSRKTPHQDQDAVATVVEGRSTPSTEGRTGPVPAENQPGHHPAQEQDKPDLDAFAARLGVTDEPAEEAVERQLAPEPERQAAPGPPKAVLAGVVLAVLALFGLFRIRRRRGRRRR